MTVFNKIIFVSALWCMWSCPTPASCIHLVSVVLIKTHTSALCGSRKWGKHKRSDFHASIALIQMAQMVQIYNGVSVHAGEATVQI